MYTFYFILNCLMYFCAQDVLIQEVSPVKVLTTGGTEMSARLSTNASTIRIHSVFIDGVLCHHKHHLYVHYHIYILYYLSLEARLAKKNPRTIAIVTARILPYVQLCTFHIKDNCVILTLHSQPCMLVELPHPLGFYN